MAPGLASRGAGMTGEFSRLLPAPASRIPMPGELPATPRPAAVWRGCAVRATLGEEFVLGGNLCMPPGGACFSPRRGGEIVPVPGRGRAGDGCEPDGDERWGRERLAEILPEAGSGEAPPVRRDSGAGGETAEPFAWVLLELPASGGSWLLCWARLMLASLLASLMTLKLSEPRASSSMACRRLMASDFAPSMPSTAGAKC